MRRNMLWWVLLAVVALAPIPLNGWEGQAKGIQYAFLVGCGEYGKGEFRRLPYTVNDVEKFRQALLESGFEADNIVLLHDKRDSTRYRPLKVNLLKELDLLLAGMAASDTLVVALSGHGVQFKGDPVSYFVPVDGKWTDKSTLIPLSGKDGLYERLKTCKAKKKLLIVNACRNDPTSDVTFASKKVELIDEDRKDEVPEGIAAIYSCMAQQKSFYDEDRKLAIFFDHVIRAWRGEYAKGAPLTLEDFFDQVKVKTKMDVNSTYGEPQIPVVMREYKGDWVIATAKGNASTSAAKKDPKKEARPWISLFNGQDLTGWKTHPDSPGKWEVKDGAIVSSGLRASLLFTERGDFENFHFRIEAKINDKGNSGQYFRTNFGPGFPPGYEAQINSTQNDEVKTGSLYPNIITTADKDERSRIYNQIVVKKPLHKPDEWFTQEVIADGNHIQIFVNGKKTVDHIETNNYFTKGHLAIQCLEAGKDKSGKVFPTIITVRKVEVMELPPTKDRDKDWVRIFNGKDLAGWKTHPQAPGKWEVKDGAILGRGNQVSHLFTERGDYENFRFRIEAKISDKGNSGQFFRAQFGSGFLKGYEAQINSTHSDTIRTGSLYPIAELPAAERAKMAEKTVIKEQLHKPDEWFTQEVIAEGNRIRIYVNGNYTVDYVDPKYTYTRGHLAIQQLGPMNVGGKQIESMVWVRKAEVKELPANKK